MTKLIFASRNFAKAPKNGNISKEHNVLNEEFWALLCTESFFFSFLLAVSRIQNFSLMQTKEETAET